MVDSTKLDGEKLSKGQFDTYSNVIGAQIADFKLLRSDIKAKRRLLPLFITAELLIIVLISNLVGYGAPRSHSLQDIEVWISQSSAHPLIAILLFTALIGTTYYTARLILTESRIYTQIELLNAKQRIANTLQNSNTNAAEQGYQLLYFARLVKINVDNLAAYYSLVKIHTNNSFNAIIFCALAGFYL